ncbi:MAG: Phenylacetic acid catabolic protein [Armatimonadota bacterium]
MTQGEVGVANARALAALVNLIAVLADTKYFLGRRVSEWTTGAPSLEAAVASAAIAQEDLGHSRAIYPLLEELPWPGRPLPLEREQDRARRYSVAFLDGEFSSWSHVVAACALIDTAVNTMFEALVDAPYEALASRVRRALEEERFHMGYAESLVRQIRAYEAGPLALQARVDELLPEMLCWFGPRGEAGVDVLKAEGLLSRNNEELRQHYLGRVAPLLLEEGIRLPVRWNLGDRRWEYDNLPWIRWDPLQRRLNRTPAA